MNGKIVFRIVSALVLVAAIAGIAFVAYNAGVANGSPVTLNAPEGQPYPMPYYHHGFGMPMPFFGFGCFGILITLFLFGMAMKAFRMMAFDRHFGHMHAHGHGPWRHGWGEKGVPPMFEEWHKRAHGEAPAEDKKE